MDVKYNIGNVVAKEHICMTHGDEQSYGDCLRSWGVVAGWKGTKWKMGTTVITYSIKYN